MSYGELVNGESLNYSDVKFFLVFESSWADEPEVKSISLRKR